MINLLPFVHKSEGERVPDRDINHIFKIQKAVQYGWNVTNERGRETDKEVEAEDMSQSKGLEAYAKAMGWGRPEGFEAGE